MFLSASCVACNDRMETSFVRFIGIIHLIFVVEGDEGDIKIVIVTVIFLVKIFINFTFIFSIRIPIINQDLSCFL